MEPLYRLFIRKDALKFSAAHMTVFPDGTKEPLHGHNYRLELTVTVAKVPVAEMVPFSSFKRVMKLHCDTWDEKVLLARQSPFLSIDSETKETCEFRLCGKRYVLPADEVVWLPVENITSESLAELLCGRLVVSLGTALRSGPVRALEVRVDEITGQGASFSWAKGVPVL